jgi:1-aminocyclopropane-1-carboxylate deaminase
LFNTREECHDGSRIKTNAAMELRSATTEVILPILKKKKVALFVKREDLLHPVISGNKYRKLYYNLQNARKLNKKKLITFGGAFSNHILATAGAGSEFDFETIGIIRGEELAEDLARTLASNPTLYAAVKLGMQLQFVSRSEYKKKETAGFLNELQALHPDAYIIPEGGTNEWAVKGCEEILNKETSLFDFVCTAVGTGGTISGIINASAPQQKVLGFPALKANFLKDLIKKNKVTKSNWELIHAYHFGGYGKVTKDLIEFVNTFKMETKIPLDPIYTAKMMFGVMDLIAKDFFPENTKILAIHTGGLQGILGMNILLQKKGLPLIEV